MISASRIRTFRRTVDGFFRVHKRDFPWRRTDNPYRILVSEIMLQQTQADRVVRKYKEFIRRFPDARSLSRASVRDVLVAWQGLGYNRRAVALHRAAIEIVRRFHGRVPRSYEDLRSLPGIGDYTAGAIMVFAYDSPSVMIETNIRSVFLHHFFRSARNVDDSTILPFIEATLDRKNPRQWYEALMDYGAYLKRTTENPSHRSRHYRKQAPFKGSDRAVCGAIVRILATKGRMTLQTLSEAINVPTERIRMNAARLIREGIVTRTGKMYTLPTRVINR